MGLNTVERQIRRAGGLAMLLVLAAIFAGIGRGLRRPVIARTGRFVNWLRRPLFYLLASSGYFGLCWRLWRPLPLALPRRLRALVLFPGSLLYFSGLALVLWGRLALGRMYNVSSSFGAQLYSEHHLITTGPFAYVRHPMYLAHHEEQALAATFGAQWDAYCRRVPRWLPEIRFG